MKLQTRLTSVLTVACLLFNLTVKGHPIPAPSPTDANVHDVPIDLDEIGTGTHRQTQSHNDDHSNYPNIDWDRIMDTSPSWGVNGPSSVLHHPNHIPPQQQQPHPVEYFPQVHPYGSSAVWPWIGPLPSLQREQTQGTSSGEPVSSTHPLSHQHEFFPQPTISQEPPVPDTRDREKIMPKSNMYLNKGGGKDIGASATPQIARSTEVANKKRSTSGMFDNLRRDLKKAWTPPGSPRISGDKVGDELREALPVVTLSQSSIQDIGKMETMQLLDAKKNALSTCRTEGKKGYNSFHRYIESLRGKQDPKDLAFVKGKLENLRYMT